MCKYLTDYMCEQGHMLQFNELNAEVFDFIFQLRLLFSVDYYSLLRSNTWNGFSPNLSTRRWISSGELSSVLRPFYFAVHPDLFGQHPEQRVRNTYQSYYKL